MMRIEVDIKFFELVATSINFTYRRQIFVFFKNKFH